MRTRGSCETHEEKRRKKFVGQPMGVTPKSWWKPKDWLLIWNFVLFLIVFDHANACASMCSLVEIHNNWYKISQHITTLFIAKHIGFCAWAKHVMLKSWSLCERSTLWVYCYGFWTHSLYFTVEGIRMLFCNKYMVLLLRVFYLRF